MKDKIKCYFSKNHNITFAVAFIAGIIVHLFTLTNILHNYDDIAVMPYGVGATASSGRWMLAVLRAISKLIFGIYNLPYINGVFTILFVAMAAAVITSIFKIESKNISAIIGLVFVTYPTTTSTMFFRFTAPYYSLGILFAVLSVKFLIKNKPLGFALSVMFTAFSLGIYQAHLPFILGILVVYLLKEVLVDTEMTFKKMIFTGLYYCLALIVSYFVYMAIMKASLILFDVELVKYQGINEMGKVSLGLLPKQILNAIKSVVLLPINNYCHLAQTTLLRIIYSALGLITLGIIVAKIKISKLKPQLIIGVLVLLALLPVAIGFIEVMCNTITNEDNYIYTIMVYSFVLLPCIPLVLYETVSDSIKCIKKRDALKRIVAVLVLILNFSNTYIANVNYTAMHYYNRQMENYISSLVTQIRMTKGFDTTKKWALVGEKIEDELVDNPWIDQEMLGGCADTKAFLKSYGRYEWFKHYIGYNVPMAEEEELEKIKKTQEFKDMPRWPNNGSIKVIDDYVVVKFSEK